MSEHIGQLNTSITVCRHAEPMLSSAASKRHSWEAAGHWDAYLKDREWGQMGVNRIAGTFGCTMEPPAATEYAVLPVGVASITPSACTCTDASPLQHCHTECPRALGGCTAYIGKGHKTCA